MIRLIDVSALALMLLNASAFAADKLGGLGLAFAARDNPAVFTVGCHSGCPPFERGSAWAVADGRRRFMFDAPNA